MTRAKDISKIVSDANFGGTLDVAGAFTSLGIDDNANATAITIDSSENVLVGTTTVLTAESNVEGISLASGSYGGLLSVSRASARSATFNRKTNDGDIVQFRKDGTAVGSIGVNSGDLAIYSTTASHSGLIFGNTRIEPSNNSGTISDNAIDLGNTDSRFKNLYLSGGVVFGATGGAVSSKTLDDYEEGSWTPGFDNVSVQQGSYVKIGNMVFCTATISTSAGGSSASVISGLPFTTFNSNAARGGGLFTYQDEIQTQTFALLVEANSTSAIIRVGSTSKALSASKDGFMSFSYRVV